MGESVGVDLLFREEYTLATAGRADAVYNRLIIEYEAPGSMRSNPNHRRAAHAIQQTKDYIDGVVEQENQDRERLLGVAGSFLMGAEDPLYPADGEGPVRRIELSSYRIDQRTVTNEDFAAFVEDTGFVTDAERFGWSFGFGGLLPDDFPPTRGAADAPWWRQVMGATWRTPEGPGTDLEGRHDHPAVHVSWNDAAAYATWVGKVLPTEARWERAARGRPEGATFPWGEELEPGGDHRMNVWQGVFPAENTLGDGFLGTCPADAFPPNDFGLFNVTGNVWEWTADWFDVSQEASTPDPTGPADGELKALKGGSFLCHARYCARYCPAARMALTPDSGASNVGFRCASVGDSAPFALAAARRSRAQVPPAERQDA